MCRRGFSAPVQFGTLQFGIAAHEFVKRPLPFPGLGSHICVEPAPESAISDRCRLRNVNAASGNPMKMPSGVP